MQRDEWIKELEGRLGECRVCLRMDERERAANELDICAHLVRKIDQSLCTFTGYTFSEEYKARYPGLKDRRLRLVEDLEDLGNRLPLGWG